MVRLKLLGGLSAQADGKTLDVDGHRKTLVLLGVVASASGGISRDKLLAYFWPESETERARNALRQRLFSLRRELQTEELFLGTTELRLNPTVVTTDVGEFEAALLAGEAERAAELYAGPLLDGVYIKDAPELERWVETQRSRLADRAAHALRAAALAAASRSDYHGALRWWRRLVELDRTNADAALGLMESLGEAGEIPAALQHFRVYETLVRAEYGGQPDTRLVATARAMASGKWLPKASATPAASGVSARVAANPVYPRGSDDVTPGERIARPVNRRVVIGAVVATGVALILLPAWMMREDNPPLVTGAMIQVTNIPGLELDPALSPDGRLIAYAAGVPGRMRIHVRQISGGRIVELSSQLPGNHRWPSWSPDGSQIAFIAGHQLFVVPALGGPHRLISDRVFRHSSPSWSPDGRSIAYSLGDSIVVRNLNDGGRQIIRTPPVTHSLSWSPDGRRLAFVSQNVEFTFGTTMVGNIGPTSLWIVGLDGDSARRIAAPTHLYASPVWMPDGQTILYISSVSGIRDVYHQVLDEDASPKRGPTRLTTGLNAHGISLSRDGSRLAYSVFTNRSNIFSAPITTGVQTPTTAVRAITNENQTIETMSVTRDGAWLAFDSDRSGIGNIYKMPANGGEPVQLTSDTAGAYVPQWSRDGKQLAFHAWRNGNRDVFIMNSNGAELKRVTSSPWHEYYADWSPDGRRLIYSRRMYSSAEAETARAGNDWESGVMIATLRPDGEWFSRDSSLVSNPLTTSGRWTHDGRYVLFAKNHRLIVQPVGEGESRTLATDQAIGAPILGTAVGPDTTVVYFRSIDSTGVHSFYSVPVRGGKPSLLLRLPDSSRRQRPEFATDGRRLYFTVAETEGDLWVMELARR